jgi:hypothetical protein
MDDVVEDAPSAGLKEGSVKENVGASQHVRWSGGKFEIGDVLM